MTGVAVVGCGRVGTRRAEALPLRARLVVCVDSDPSRADALAARHPGAEISTDWAAALDHEGVEIVVVATTHEHLAPLAAAAATAGKHVLLEKPGARRAHELDAVDAAVRATGAKVRVGFNHRRHPALRRMHDLVVGGAIGPLLHIRGRYGHGGRPGYASEWRADPVRGGGGELLDQGIHLIDLTRWLAGDLAEVDGILATSFWDAPVEDNAFLLGRTTTGAVVQLHASWTEWKNLFSLEVFGRDGKLEVLGLGGSYGTETLVHHRMGPDLGPPEEVRWSFDGPDRSWGEEVEALLDDIELDRTPDPGLADARAALDVVGRLYAAAGR